MCVCALVCSYGVGITPVEALWSVCLTSVTHCSKGRWSSGKKERQEKHFSDKKKCKAGLDFLQGELIESLWIVIAVISCE